MITKLRYSSSRETGNTFLFFPLFSSLQDNKFALPAPSKVTDGSEVFKYFMNCDFGHFDCSSIHQKGWIWSPNCSSLASKEFLEFGSCELDFSNQTQSCFAWVWLQRVMEEILSFYSYYLVRLRQGQQGHWRSYGREDKITYHYTPWSLGKGKTTITTAIDDILLSHMAILCVKSVNLSTQTN